MCALRPSAFRTQIRKYIAAHAYGVVTTSDLWAGLQAAAPSASLTVRRSRTQVMGLEPGHFSPLCAAVGRGTAQVNDFTNTWTSQPGYPLLRITLTATGYVRASLGVRLGVRLGLD